MDEIKINRDNIMKCRELILQEKAISKVIGKCDKTIGIRRQLFDIRSKMNNTEQKLLQLLNEYNEIGNKEVITNQVATLLLHSKQSSVALFELFGIDTIPLWYLKTILH